MVTHIKRRKWSPTDDMVLISSWLNTNKDPVVGNEQRPDAFWKRIAANFASSHKVQGLEPRDPSHCKQRWQKITNLVSKFVKAYEAAKTQQTSGQNDNDTLKLAHQIFHNDHKIRFNLEYAWKELRNNQKWCSSFNSKASGSSKRRKGEDGTAQSLSSHTVIELDPETMAPPTGVKAAIGKRSMSKTSTVENEATSLVNFQSMWAIKEKGLAMKERVSKIGLLESLLAKKEPLSEIEVALKNKLITDMLSH